MVKSIIAFMVMLNPFALFLYLQPVMKELSSQDFAKVVFRASLISFGIFFFFQLTGVFLFRNVLQIRFEAFRIFGGVVIFSFAFLYIVKGQRALIQMKEDLEDLASEIALPFKVGAGTISLSILMAEELPLVQAFFSLVLSVTANALAILLLKWFRDSIERRKFRVAFDKNMEILMRLNGFFLGAIGVNMTVTGINNLSFHR